MGETTRADTTRLITGKTQAGDRGLGVLGSQVPSTGTSGPAYLYNDLSLPAEANDEFYGLITSFPVGLTTFFANEDSSFTATGPDGFYTFTYSGYKNGVLYGSATVSFSIGAISAIPGTWSWSGTTATFTGLVVINAIPGTWSWAGTTAATSKLINASIGAYTWAGTTGTFGSALNAIPGTWSWVGTTATIPKQVTHIPGTWSWTGTTASIPSGGNMPNVVGVHWYEAAAMLIQAGITPDNGLLPSAHFSTLQYFANWPVTVNWVKAAGVTPGFVVGQNPPSGSVVAFNAAITLTVAMPTMGVSE